MDTSLQIFTLSMFENSRYNPVPEKAVMKTAKFHIGQVLLRRKFDCRGARAGIDRAGIDRAGIDPAAGGGDGRHAARRALT